MLQQVVIVIVCALLPRSQRDLSGEKEQRAKQLMEFQEKLSKLEEEVTTAENDRRQFDADIRKETEARNEQRYGVWVCVCLSVCPSVLGHSGEFWLYLLLNVMQGED